MKRNPFDLKMRTRQFAADVRTFLRDVPPSDANREDGRQLIRASGSVAANYLEADNALSPKDRLMRLRICLKEARECGLWLGLLCLGDSSPLTEIRRRLESESDELAKILATLVRRSRR